MTVAIASRWLDARLWQEYGRGDFVSVRGPRMSGGAKGRVCWAWLEAPAESLAGRRSVLRIAALVAGHAGLAAQEHAVVASANQGLTEAGDWIHHDIVIHGAQEH